jgi:two-component system KDP operon response regulator KdpE
VTNVVLLDLDQGSRRIEAAALRYGGYEVSTAHTVEQTITRVRTHPTDAVLVDPAQFDIGELVAELRARTELPIIVVSEGEIEGEGESALVSALDAGADDYVSKPFVVEELLARMRAVLRRKSESEIRAAIVTEDFTIDIAARRAFRADGCEIFLTGVEFRMVEILLRRPGHVVTRAQILEEIWGPRGVRSPHYLRVFVNRVRQKLEPDPAHPRYLHTATGLGLVFKLERSSADEHAHIPRQLEEP